MTKRNGIDRELDLLTDALGDVTDLADEELDSALRARGVEPDAAVAEMLAIVEKHEASARTAWIAHETEYISKKLNILRRVEQITVDQIQELQREIEQEQKYLKAIRDHILRIIEEEKKGVKKNENH